MRPLSPPVSRSSTAVTSAWSSRPPRGRPRWAIFVLLRLTRKRKIGGDVLLLPAEKGQRLDEVVLHDLARAAEALEPLEREHVVALVDSRAPEPLEDELEERRLDAVAHGRFRRNRRAAVEREVAEAAPSTAGITFGSMSYGASAGEHGVPCRDRPFDRLVGRVDVEVVDAKVVGEQQRDVPLELIELRPRVLADRDEDVHGEGGVADDVRAWRRSS